MFQSWPSIESFHRVRTDVLAYAEVSGIQFSRVVYRGKTKLHGSNAGIVILPHGLVLAQSRSRIITIPEDNMGFASWLEEHRGRFMPLKRKEGPITIYGEWCGKGIQKQVAVSKLDRTIFAIFAVQFGDSSNFLSSVFVEPTKIAEILEDVKLPDNVYILPWQGDKVEVDFFDRESTIAAVEVINQAVKEVEECDPFVSKTFGIDGLGEGLVYYPVSMANLNGSIPRTPLQRFMFKAKGTKHQVVKTREAVEIDPEVAESLASFIDQVATEARMEQAVSEGAKNKFDKRFIGPVIAWFCRDVKKDIDNREVIMPELIEWKAVSKALTSHIQKWYLSKLEQI